MNDLKEEKGTREELRRSQAAPRRSGGGLKRALMVILALVVVLAVVVAAAWKDLSSLDSVRRLFSYNKVTQDEQGKVELCSFSNDRSNTFALLGDHLIVASTTGVSDLQQQRQRGGQHECEAHESRHRCRRPDRRGL